MSIVAGLGLFQVNVPQLPQVNFKCGIFSTQNYELLGTE